ncbi:Hypothetical protein Eab7_2472 [Exiguobacterium antarcticum B7]|nr:Hypothetical protein Eab7_2472 [Exiguobacterium antarcticum B7]
MMALGLITEEAKRLTRPATGSDGTDAVSTCLGKWPRRRNPGAIKIRRIPGSYNGSSLAYSWWGKPSL